MVAALHQGSALPGQPPPGEPPPPINYIYTHLHDSIRAELDTLAEAVTALQAAGAANGGAGLGEGLRALRDRYHFLEQVYKYHSSVEDEVGAAQELPRPQGPRDRAAGRVARTRRLAPHRLGSGLAIRPAGPNPALVGQSGVDQAGLITAPMLGRVSLTLQQCPPGRSPTWVLTN